MGAYEIRVKVELVERKDSDGRSDPVKANDGSFTMKISEGDALNIDKCETAVLRTAYPTIREAVSNHLTEMSKKKPSNKRNAEK